MANITPSYVFSTGSESLNESTTSSSLLHTIKVLTTTQPSYLYNLISVQCTRSTRSSSVVTRSCSATFITLSKKHWSLLSLCFTFFLESSPFISLSTSFRYQFLHFRLTYPSPITFSSFYSPFCSSIIPSLFHSRLKTYLFHKSYPLVSLLPSGLPSRTFARIVSSEHFRFWFLVFPYFCVTVPCGRSTWPSRQLLSARKYTVSYSIVSYGIVFRTPWNYIKF